MASSTASKPAKYNETSKQSVDDKKKASQEIFKTSSGGEAVIIRNGWSKLSNMSITPLCMSGIRYVCAHQALLAVKAGRYENWRAFGQIMMKKAPRFMGLVQIDADEPDWLEHQEKILLNILWHKFNQNEPAKQELLETGTRMLIYAPNVDDDVLGCTVKLAENSVLDPANISGGNLLGRCLVKIREDLQRNC